MSELKAPKPVKPIAAVFSAEPDFIRRAVEAMESFLGVSDFVSRPLEFDQTDYYRPEMGGPLVKRLIAFDRLIDPTELIDIKVRTNRIEQESASDGRRRVNIDPGYLSAERLVLATGKPAAHRIYLGQGVWADLTLVYQSGDFITLAWTYPDFASAEMTGLLTDIRRHYLDQLKTAAREKL